MKVGVRILEVVKNKGSVGLLLHFYNQFFKNVARKYAVKNLLLPSLHLVDIGENFLFETKWRGGWDV